jgi:hypothetical protein
VKSAPKCLFCCQKFEVLLDDINRIMYVGLNKLKSVTLLPVHCLVVAEIQKCSVLRITWIKYSNHKLHYTFHPILSHLQHLQNSLYTTYLVTLTQKHNHTHKTSLLSSFSGTYMKSFTYLFC